MPPSGSTGTQTPSLLQDRFTILVHLKFACPPTSKFLRILRELRPFLSPEVEILWRHFHRSIREGVAFLLIRKTFDVFNICTRQSSPYPARPRNIGFDKT